MRGVIRRRVTDGGFDDAREVFQGIHPERGSRECIHETEVRRDRDAERARAGDDRLQLVPRGVGVELDLAHAGASQSRHHRVGIGG